MIHSQSVVHSPPEHVPLLVMLTIVGPFTTGTLDEQIGVVIFADTAVLVGVPLQSVKLTLPPSSIVYKT